MEAKFEVSEWTGKAMDIVMKSLQLKNGKVYTYDSFVHDVMLDYLQQALPSALEAAERDYVNSKEKQ